MSIRPVLPLLLLASLLAGSTAYLAMNGGSEGPPAVDPGGHGVGIDELEQPVVDQDPASVAGDLPLVRVEIQPVSRLLERAETPVCRLLRGRSGEEMVPARATFVAGSAAAAVGDTPATGPQLVELELMSGERFYRVVRLPRGRELEPVDVRLEGPFALEGRALGAEGQPLSGARVWLAGRPEVVTDEDGVFRVEGVNGRVGLPLVIRADGHADLFREVSWRASLDRPDYHLTEGADLIVRLASELPKEGESLVYLRPRGGNEMDLSLQHYPFFWPAVGGAPRLGVDASCRLTGLPKGVQVEVLVQNPLVRTEVAVVDLRRSLETVTVRGEAGPAVRGQVVRPDGAPAPGVLVMCRRRGGAVVTRNSLSFLLPASAQLAHVAHGFTAADGSFAVARDPDMSPQWITALSTGPVGLENDLPGRVAAPPLSLTLPSGGPVEGDPTLRLVSKRPVRLVVVRGQSRDPAVGLAPGAPHVIRLAGPAVLDVTVEGVDGQRRYPGLAVRGVVDLDV